MAQLEPHVHLSAHGQHHDHAHGHQHDHQHDHDHGHQQHAHGGWLGRIIHLLPFSHSHAAEDKIDAALEQSERGIWALKVSLVGLGATALFQLVIVLLSGSVALLADTIHNLGDALTALPLWVAFVLSRSGRCGRAG